MNRIALLFTFVTLLFVSCDKAPLTEEVTYWGNSYYCLELNARTNLASWYNISNGQYTIKRTSSYRISNKEITFNDWFSDWVGAKFNDDNSAIIYTLTYTTWKGFNKIVKEESFTLYKTSLGPNSGTAK